MIFTISVVQREAAVPNTFQHLRQASFLCSTAYVLCCCKSNTLWSSKTKIRWSFKILNLHLDPAKTWSFQTKILPQFFLTEGRMHPLIWMDYWIQGKACFSREMMFHRMEAERWGEMMHRTFGSRRCKMFVLLFCLFMATL